MARLTGTQQGFTLIEILVVLVLVGLLAGVAVLTMGGSTEQRALEQDARRLYLTLQTAAELAVTGNQEIGVRVSDSGYQFLTLDAEDGEWRESETRLLKGDQFAPGVVVTHQLRAGLPRLADKSADQRPDLVFLSSGAVTGFEITLGRASGPVYRIASDGRLPLTWDTPEGEA
ncbi:MAG: general secretion pathway protein H [Marinobacter sp. T13-3]|nr:MAG: general secretion pathway protein H [Marinobacter sp. T13-3]